MPKIAELAVALKRITELESQLSEAKEAARLLWEDVGSELGVPESRVAQVRSAKRPGPRPRNGKSDEKRTHEALKDFGREASIGEVHLRLRESGREVPRRSVGSYLVQANAKGIVERIRPGVYRWRGEGGP